MIQLAAMVQPTNRAKQSAPNWIIRLGCERWVMPNTIDVKSEKSSSALK